MQTLDARLVRQMQPMLEQVQADHQADQHSVPANLWSYSHNGLVIASQSIWWGSISCCTGQVHLLDGIPVGLRRELKS